MIIQITGTGTTNKGAELLLVAAKRQLTELFPDAKLAVNAGFGSWEDRARYGLHTVLPESPRGRWWLAGRMMPAAFRASCGLVAERDVDAVLDASGFAFGDQLGVDRVRRFSKDVARWKQQGKPVILLPQAFGPFENPEVREHFQRVASAADLIFAREEKSFEYVKQLTGDSSTLQQAPDFTALVHPDITLHTEFDAFVVPNFQMIAKTNADRGAQYIPFLGECVVQLEQRGKRVAVLLHDDRVDSKVLMPLMTHLGREVAVVTESDPVRLKALLGSASLVVGSRFHALVSSLSQGVPTIAAGWSHKYEMLLKDYECPEAMLDVSWDAAQIGEVIGQLLKDRDNYVVRLAAAAERIREESRLMWQQVAQKISRAS